MGSGKTSWAIQTMNEHPDKSYIYITPLLTEVRRIKESTSIHICEPKNTGQGKLASLHELLASGENIVSTHSLFCRISEETRQLIRRGNYTLILDEVMDVVNIYDGLKCDDIKLLFEKELVTLDENNFLVWNDASDYPESKYSDVQHLAQNKSLVLMDNSILLWNFPVSVFELFEQIYILTYQFNGQYMRVYYDLNHVKYEYKSVAQIDGRYSLADYKPELEDRAVYWSLINILENDALNCIGDKRTAFSKSWFDRKRKTDKASLDLVKNNLTNYFKHKVHATSGTIAWSTYKSYKRSLSAPGRLYTRKLTADEIKLKGSGSESIRKLECFVPCNSRATNIYSDRCNIAYLVNLFPNPLIQKYFSSNKAFVDDDQYALCEMLQWIWRSRIRNMEPINIYIPSERMRELLKNWIASK